MAKSIFKLDRGALSSPKPVILMAACLALVTIAAARIAQQPVRLQDRAARVASVRDWDTTGTLFWLNQDEVYFCHTSKQSFAGSNDGLDDFNVYRYRRSTGTSELIQPLSSLLKRLNISVRDGHIYPSPDRKWLLVGSDVTCRPDGTGVVRYVDKKAGPYDMPFMGMWMPDSKHLFMYVNSSAGDYCIVYSVPSGRRDRNINFSLGGKLSGISYNHGFLPKTGGFIEDEPRTEAPYMLRAARWDFYRWSLLPPETPKMIGHIQAPPGASITGTAISGETGRIAFIALNFPEAPADGSVKPVLGNLLLQQALVTSRLDGTDVHELGRSTNEPISNLQWVPGTYLLSFTGGGHLYTIEVP